MADGVARIIIDSKEGIVGQAFQMGQTVIENDMTNNPHFSGEQDHQSNFKTKNIMAIPIFSSDNKTIGVLELLNKECGFEKSDEEFMKFFIKYISSFIEITPPSSDVYQVTP